jgi:hypothetical protein
VRKYRSCASGAAAPGSFADEGAPSRRRSGLVANVVVRQISRAVESILTAAGRGVLRGVDCPHENAARTHPSILARVGG